MILGLLVFTVMLLLVLPLLVPLPSLGSTVPPEELAVPDSRFVEVDGVRVHYKDEGEGKPALVLLHGFADNVFVWRDVIGPLSSFGRVVSLDWPPFGLTSRPMPEDWVENPYTLAARVSLVVGLMDALGIERAVLVGHSMGATLASQVALVCPGRIRGMVLLAPALFLIPSTPTFLRWLLTTRQMRWFGPLAVRSLRSVGMLMAKRGWRDPDRITPEEWDGYLRPMRAHNWERAFWEFVAALRPPTARGRLSELSLPVLVVEGADDRVIPRWQVERTVSGLPETELVVIQECGHQIADERPAELVRAINGFLERMLST